MHRLLDSINRAIGRMPDWFYFTSLAIMMGISFSLLAGIFTLLTR